MDAGEFNGRRLYSGLRLDYRLQALRWAPTFTSRVISAVAELLDLFCLHFAVAKQTYVIITFTLFTEFSPERDHVTFGTLPSQIRLSSVCLAYVCL